jgi:hypothetical protein
MHPEVSKSQPGPQVNTPRVKRPMSEQVRPRRSSRSHFSSPLATPSPQIASRHLLVSKLQLA